MQAHILPFTEQDAAIVLPVRIPCLDLFYVFGVQLIGDNGHLDFSDLTLWHGLSAFESEREFDAIPEAASGLRFRTGR